MVTFAGAPEAVLEGAIRGAGRAAELIDLSRHEGVHPRVGAADVIPFVPLDGATIDDCVDAAHRAGEEIWSRFGVPVYFYEAAAQIAESKAFGTCPTARVSTVLRRILATSRRIQPLAPRWSARADF